MTTPGLARTKIVCTLGPSTATESAIGDLLDAGMNVARINFSHGTHAEHAATIARVRAAADARRLPVAILGDLQGPRIRIGDLSSPVEVATGDDVTLAPEDALPAGAIPVTYHPLASDVHTGDRILVDDGLIELMVLDTAGDTVHARVVHGGQIKSHKGLNLPGIHVSAPSITEKDHADIGFAVEQGLDYLALSFVRRAEDIADLRERIPKKLLVIAKIEKDIALTNIESIMRAADGVMVARGDLGVELPFEEVPIAQKRIIRLANRLGKPVITATQMLESMIEHPRPTRAEASDVANAILDGTDAVMLSAETAAGAFPRLAVEAMRRIICEVECHPLPWRSRDEERRDPGSSVATEEAIAAATIAAQRMLATPLVIVLTKGGFSARVVSSHRPRVPILALTDMAQTYRQLALVWGVVPHLVAHCTTYDEMVALARQVAVELGLARPGDRVLVTAGVPFDVPGTTNLLKVETV
ncbi:MAG TPA: pyruvate kinase [Gemmatimonadaceae bacterium]|nr:pyruvate kinase [Gemmatimonadaceae bacterium]